MILSAGLPARAFALASVLVFAAVPLAGQAVSLPDPGFEEGLSRWTVPAEDAGMSEASAEAARTGKFGLKVTDGSEAAGSSVFSRRLPAKAGEGYELAFHARVTAGGGVGVYLIFYDKDDKRIDPADRFVRSLRGTSGWRRHVLHAIAPENATKMAVWIHSYGQAKVTAHFDDFALRGVPADQVRLVMPAQDTGLPDFPKVAPEKAYAESKVLQPNGSVLRTPIEDWAGARRLVAEDAEWAEWARARRAATEAWMARHRERAEWQSGWWHHFVSPKDGSFLVWTDDVPGEEVDHLMSRSGHRVDVTVEIFEAWVFGFRKRHLEQVVEAARLYRLTGEDRFAEWAASQLDFYAMNYDGWGKNPRQRAHSHIGWQSLEDATWLTLMVDTARLLFDYADTPRRQAWFDRLFKPQVALLSSSRNYIHNISAWHRAASAQVALLYGDEDMWRGVVEGPHGIRRQITAGVTSDYFWYEQAMGYNAYVMVATRPLFTFAGLLGQGDRLREEAAIVQNIMIAPLMIRFPDGTVPNPADAHRPVRASAGGLGSLYRILPTRAGLAAVANVRSWDTLVDPPTWPVGSTDLPDVTSRHLESTRFALMKKGPWQVFFHYGQLHISHSQAEALNWSASFEGVDISHDPGTVGYGSPMHRGYYTRGLNHNVPLVNGEGQVSWNPGHLSVFDEKAGVMTAEQPGYRPDASARRTLRIDGDRLIDEVAVTTTADERATLGHALHLSGEPKLPDAFKPVPNFAENRPPEFAHWTEVRSAVFTDEAFVDVVFAEGKTLRVRLATPGRFTVYQGSSPAEPPDRRAGFYIEKTEPATTAVFTTEFVPVR